MGRVVTEREVVKIWQDFLPGNTDLKTEEGGTVRIVYPGRPNDDRGADWRDAVIDTGGDIRRGDIEIHVRSSNWRGHRHHQDPIYNRVILHVVYQHDAAAAVLQNGREIPTLALDRYTGDRNIECVGHDPRIYPQSMPCHVLLSGRDTGVAGRILDDAGDRRFHARVIDFKEKSGKAGSGQSLYESIIGALGYTRNKQPMIELAYRMPLERLATPVTVTMPDNDYLAHCQGLLMGMAGLLPSQRAAHRRQDDLTNEWITRLEEVWEAYGETATMSAGDWSLFKIRPGNFPRRRIAAMSYLLLRYRDDGLLAGLINEIEEVSPEDNGGSPGRLLTVAAAGYWGRNLDFDLPGGRRIPALLGINRAQVIVVNVLLPFAVAWGRKNGYPALAEKAVEMYRSHPVLPENTLERHMRRQLGIGDSTVNTARRQQGLIHVYKTLCSQGRCGECPLNRDQD